ncbi:ATP-binding SpoIIE family protein phosphatase [Teredinibacter purpureus]|uniref:ATP-binding SpoIIE family protein phosphatase n=1 Tax=Teredinibacter purpureus TaxID=2731756 RepID=UPI0005F77FA8|nr:SpoIIE family protein phosphatase [Teredinibacter purpureus]
MPNEKEQSLNILIAEDSAPDRLILESIVARAGHVPIPVADGQEAIEAYKEHKPDIIMLDVLMPRMGGVEAAREIRALTRDEFVPIIFLTSLSDDESLVECIEAGGDDFLPKPYNPVVLVSKIKAFGRMRDMHLVLAQQKSLIQAHNQHLIQEQEVAKQVYDKIAHSGCLDLDIINAYMSPLAVFNGDVLVAEVSPNGSILILLGDFTGHGLPAAIGSMPLASTFYGMARKGFSMPDIIKEINTKLHEILPIGFFCCATCIDINLEKRRMRIWNGGLPESFLYRARTNSYEMLQSRNLPLGVLSTQNFKANCKRIPLEIGDRFYMWSDGVFEARDSQGEMFGESRLHALMDRRIGSSTLFDEILGQVHNHIGDSDKDDDISLVEVLIDDFPIKRLDTDTHTKAKGQLVDWALTFEVSESSLKEFDPLPLLVNITSEVPGLKDRSTTLYTVLAELYANALEHGVLGLSSELKKTPQGFAEFYKLKHDRLQSLDKGSVRVCLKHVASPSGGLLNIRIIDSGKGFTPTEKTQETSKVVAPPTPSKPNYFGRGLSLMDSICEKLTIHPPGNDIEVDFRWHLDDGHDL